MPVEFYFLWFFKCKMRINPLKCNSNFTVYPREKVYGINLMWTADERNNPRFLGKTTVLR